MARRDTALLGAPCWMDLLTSDPEGAETFYGRVLGWTAAHTGPEFNNYVNFSVGDARVSGMMRNDGSEHPDGWTVYFATSDAKASVETAVAAGAQVFLEPHQAGDLGTFAVLGDVGGAPFALWQPGNHQGFQVAAEPGAPAWFELHTRDHAAAVDFYSRTLGAQPLVMSDTDDFRYTQLMIDGDPHAGIMDRAGSLPEHVPAHWQIYFGVVDVDASAELVTQLGGAVLEPAVDTPYGRLAQVADPTGAVFRLVGVPAS